MRATRALLFLEAAQGLAVAAMVAVHVEGAAVEVQVISVVATERGTGPVTADAALSAHAPVVAAVTRSRQEKNLTSVDKYCCTGSARNTIHCNPTLTIYCFNHIADLYFGICRSLFSY